MSRRRSRREGAPVRRPGARPSDAGEPAQAAGAATAAGGRPTSWWRRRVALVAAVVAFLVYAPSTAGGFLYDDINLIVRNPFIRNLREIRTVLRYEPSRPLLNLSWALNFAAFGEAPWHYHLVNVAIHAANAALLASLFLWMARRWRVEDAERAAVFGAGLFALTPMAAETVAYVASRSSALGALFVLASLRVAAPALAGGPRTRVPLALLLFGMALATKEEAAALPLLLLLLDYFFVAGQKLRGVASRAWIHASFLAVVPLGLVARRLATGAWLPAPAVDPWLYTLTQWAAFPLYLLRAAVPVDPAFYRHHPPSGWPPDAATIAWAVVTAVVLVLAVRLRRVAASFSFAVLCLFAGLLPSSSIVSLNEMVVDHRAYLGSLGVAFAMGLLLHRFGGLRSALLVSAALVPLTLWYQWVLADPVRAWEHAVRRAPASADARCALAESYAERGDPRAEVAFLAATRLDPSRYRYWANLGLYYAERARYEPAVAALKEAVRLAPGEAAVRDYLGQLLEQLGRDDEAAAEYEAALGGVPPSAQPYTNLAALLLRRGDKQRARELLESAMRLASTREEADRIIDLRRQLP